MVVVMDVATYRNCDVAVMMVYRPVLFHDNGVVFVVMMMVVVPVAIVIVIDHSLVSLCGRRDGKTSHGRGAQNKNTD